MKIAIVGSGVSGLSAAWLLSEHSAHEVHIFEKNDYIGGHTHTIDYPAPTTPEGRHPLKPLTVPVDTGFIVFNHLTYTNLIRFLNHKRVEFIDSEMTFSVCRDAGKFEWSGSNLLTVFAQPSNLVRWGHWRMIYDIIKFNIMSLEVLGWAEEDERKQWSLKQYLDWRGFGREFKDNYLLPMTAAIWSTPPDKCSFDFPALTLIRFMHNHCLLQVDDRPKWLTIKDGSRSYIQAILPTLKHAHPSTPISSVRRNANGTTTLLGGTSEAANLGTYDHVIFASHADETLRILGDQATIEERRVLGGIRFSENEVYVHTDERLMPSRRSVWTSWNYLSTPGKDGKVEDSVSLTYWMNNLQRYIPTEIFGQIFVTMNPPATLLPEPSKTHARYTYTHPAFTPHLISSQPLFRLPLPTPSAQTLQGVHNTWHAGAWTGYGFHEDGFTAGAKVAVALGAQSPFEINEARYEDGEREKVQSAIEAWARAWWYDRLERVVAGAVVAATAWWVAGVVGLTC
ncbi:FAD/NAD(P)-binding domain-containing protein [Jimgerdemannia flammicorona]|uniref:FAD/NAD(P)-binding domain-containing protein n=1 Tax=Jimgerdemannia flammicorona TaxID=994334 RepID=A0A433D562_9FUNG|nr:FAD/NAD(P)-binding domain-containing protein [Jimgerdemannia flammicorona]